MATNGVQSDFANMSSHSIWADSVTFSSFNRKKKTISRILGCPLLNSNLNDSINIEPIFWCDLMLSSVNRILCRVCSTCMPLVCCWAQKLIAYWIEYETQFSFSTEKNLKKPKTNHQFQWSQWTANGAPRDGYEEGNKGTYL